MSDKPYWSTAQLAQEAGVTGRYVRQEIKTGRLKGEKLGHDWLILAEDARVWLAKKSGRKRKAE